MEVEEHFHVQHACATPSDLSYFKRNKYSQGMTPLNDSTASYCEKLLLWENCNYYLKQVMAFLETGFAENRLQLGFKWAAKDQFL